ncbi:MAG TPA: hypothetical protein VNC17_18145 [Thermoleophilaceae bacterium]|nr:hypothetical protein [Thermoleophilaceae bacterium]
MTTPTAGTATEAQTRAWRPTFSGPEIGFLTIVPLGWAVVLLFHGAPDGADVYGSLRDEASRYLTVHLVSLVFLGLMGAALYLLLRDLPGRAAQISRLAILPFVVFYVAGDAIAGVATGALVDHANDLPASERAGTADAVQALWDDFITGDLLLGLGAASWIVAALAAAVAYARAGAPIAVTVLLALSALVFWHTPPIGPVGLVCFAAAVVLVAGRWPPRRTVATP